MGSNNQRNSEIEISRFLFALGVMLGIFGEEKVGTNVALLVITCLLAAVFLMYFANFLKKLFENYRWLLIRPC